MEMQKSCQLHNSPVSPVLLVENQAARQMKHKATRHKNYILWLFSLSTRTSLCWNEHSDPGNAISTRKLQVQVPITRGTPRAGSKGGGVLQSLEQAIHDDALQR